MWSHSSKKCGEHALTDPDWDPVAFNHLLQRIPQSTRGRAPTTGDRDYQRSGLPATGTTAAAAPAGRLGSRRPLLGFVDAQRTSTHLEAVRLLNCVLRFARPHVHERKSPGTPGFAIVDEFDRFDFAVAFEQRTHFVFCSSEWQIANVDRRHSTNLTSSVSTLRHRRANRRAGACTLRPV